MKDFRYHPEIEGLKVNENGSEVFLNENPVIIKVRDKGNHLSRFFYYKNKQIGLAKLVLECWEGLAPEPNQRAIHKNNDHTDYHYKNLKWGLKAGNTKFPQKLTKEQKTEIFEKLEAGQSGYSLAKEYGVTRGAIYQMKNKQAE